MPGMVLVTDHNWFQFLSRQTVLDEVNFWQPSAPRPPQQLRPGDPVFFKHHKADGGRIGGLGFYASFSSSSVWLAWEAFGIKNGAPDYASFCGAIGARRGRRDRPIDEHEIGCVMLSSPVFFELPLEVRGPADWSDEIVVGKYLDLASGDGARIWEECQQRLAAVPSVLEPIGLSPAEGARYSEPVLARRRLGQGIFRLSVTTAYGRACAVTGEHSLPALEAAHIRPFSEGGAHEVTNGLLLRSDIHRLFDTGYVGVSPDHHFIVSKRLKDAFSNGRSYYPLQGQELHLPQSQMQHPDPNALEWHLSQRFKG